MLKMKYLLKEIVNKHLIWLVADVAENDLC